MDFYKHFNLKILLGNRAQVPLIKIGSLWDCQCKRYVDIIILPNHSKKHQHPRLIHV